MLIVFFYETGISTFISGRRVLYPRVEIFIKSILTVYTFIDQGYARFFFGLGHHGAYSQLASALFVGEYKRQYNHKPFLLLIPNSSESS